MDASQTNDACNDGPNATIELNAEGIAGELMTTAPEWSAILDALVSTGHRVIAMEVTTTVTSMEGSATSTVVVDCAPPQYLDDEDDLETEH